MFPPKDRVTICFAHAAYQLQERFLRRQLTIHSFEVRTLGEFERRIGEADVLVVSGLWRNDLLDRAQRLRFIQSISAGTDQFDRGKLTQRGIRLASAQGVNVQAVSEHAMALLLAMTRKLPQARDNQAKSPIQINNNPRLENWMNIPSWFSSPLQSALFYGSLLIWAATELVNTLVIGRHRPGGRRKDRGSYFGVSIAINLAFVLMLLLRSLGVGLLPTLFQWVGLAMVWAGGLVREWAILSLGRAFTVVVEVNPSQSLITSGPYRWVRHPAYTSILILLGGFGLAVGSWLGAILAMAVTLVGFSYRVRVEERAMLEAFGDEYRNYMHHTGRYLPRVL